MRVFEIQEIIHKHTSEIKDKVIPVVTEKVMDSFNEGFECGMDIGCKCIRDATIDWLYNQLSEDLISVRDMDTFIERYKNFIETQMKKKDEQP